MNTVVVLLFLVLFSVLCCTSFAATPACTAPTIYTTLWTSWTSGGNTHYLYNIQFSSPSALTHVQIGTGPNSVISDSGDFESPGQGKLWEISLRTPNTNFTTTVIIINNFATPTIALEKWSCGYHTRPIQKPYVVGVCDFVLIIDYQIRTSARWSTYNISAIETYYKQYVYDISHWYETHHNIVINLTYIYVEPTSSFTSTTDAGDVLDDFIAAVKVGTAFGPGFPRQACQYHFLSNRFPGSGVAPTLAGACDNVDYMNTAVSGLQYDNEPDAWGIHVMIHEMAHVFGGTHPDQYVPPACTDCVCFTNTENRQDHQIMRRAYTFLSDGAFISDCATSDIRAHIPSFDCLWKTPFFAVITVTFYEHTNLAGSSFAPKTVYGPQKRICTNIDRQFNDLTSSFQITGDPTVAGLIIFTHSNCRGPYYVYNSRTVNDVGVSADNVASSYYFI